jgi:hypothetical protein
VVDFTRASTTARTAVPEEESELDNADEHEDYHDDHDHAHDSNATVSRIHFYPPFRTLIR